MQQRFDGAGTREVEEDAVSVLFDLHCPFEEGEHDRRGLGLRERGGVECRGAQGMMQDIGGTRQEEPQRVRQKSGGCGAVAVQVTFDRLDIVFTIPTRTVDVLIRLWLSPRTRMWV